MISTTPLFLMFSSRKEGLMAKKVYVTKDGGIIIREKEKRTFINEERLPNSDTIKRTSWEVPDKKKK